MGAAEQVTVGDTWFVDDRSIVRRMRVSWHPDRRLVVLSLWQGESCTGTFRLPIEEASRLIAVLAADLGAAVGKGSGPPEAPPRLPARLRSWWRTFAARRRREAAVVVPLDRYR